MISNKKTKKYLIKEALTDWSLSCTFHCYPKIFQYKNNSLRIIWFALFVSFTGFTGYLVSKSIIDYFEFEVVSKIQLTNVDHLEFPTITICDTNLFTTKQAESYFERMWTNLTEKNLSDDFNLADIETFSNLSPFIRFHAASLSDDKKKLFGLSHHNFRFCQFNMKKCNSTEALKWFYSMDLGNCFQFNSIQPLRESLLQGELNGLHLIVGPLVNSNQKDLISNLGKGLKIFIKDDTYIPNSLDESFWQSTGKLAKISMKKVVSYNQPKPYTNCEDLNSLVKVKYSQIL